ncbi:MAG: ComF family protein [Actinobacteria bacterium]|nr:ComF family protein [Actinomycetota bacterium]
MPTPPLITDVFDLVLGRTCLHCQTPGPALCPPCLAQLRGNTRPVSIPGLVVPACAATDYDGIARDAILEYKERGSRSLAPMLGRLLADAAMTVARPQRPSDCVLIPVPSHRYAPRGFDALGSVARAAAQALTRDGLPSRVEHRLRPGPAYLPMKGLGRGERQSRITGAFRPMGRTRPSPWDEFALLVDDVVTTGATASEALRTLAAAGTRVSGIAAVAAPSRGTRGTIHAPAQPRCRP